MRRIFTIRISFLRKNLIKPVVDPHFKNKPKVSLPRRPGLNQNVRPNSCNSLNSFNWNDDDAEIRPGNKSHLRSFKACKNSKQKQKKALKRLKITNSDYQRR